jgi:hypothetical protein
MRVVAISVAILCRAMRCRRNILYDARVLFFQKCAAPVGRVPLRIAITIFVHCIHRVVIGEIRKAPYLQFIRRGTILDEKESRQKHDPKKPDRRLTHRGVTTMNTMTKIALVATLLAGTTSFAAAEGFDPNLANRYPSYANPVAARPFVSAQQDRAFQTAPVGLYQNRNVRLNTQRSYGGEGYSQSYGAGQSEFGIDARDHASSPYAGGGF